MFIWRNEELQRAAQGNVAANSDNFRDELGVAETAGEGGEEMDMSQNSEDECQAKRTEMVLTSLEKDGDVGLAVKVKVEEQQAREEL